MARRSTPLVLALTLLTATFLGGVALAQPHGADGPPPPSVKSEIDTLKAERLWMTGEMMRVHGAPYSGAFTPYTAGMSGWMPMLQTVLAF